MPTSAAAVQAPVAEASTHLMLDLPRLNWLWRSGTRQTSMPWAASVSYRPGSPRVGGGGAGEAEAPLPLAAPQCLFEGPCFFFLNNAAPPAFPPFHRLGEAPG